jgi:hypothetical protein
MKLIGTLLLASSMSWPVAALSQLVQQGTAHQSDEPHAADGRRQKQKRRHVDCDREPAGALQKAIAAADAGDTLLVSGTCHEHVTVPVGADSITLDGRGMATIIGPDPAVPTLLVR